MKNKQTTLKGSISGFGYRCQVVRTERSHMLSRLIHVLFFIVFALLVFRKDIERSPLLQDTKMLTDISQLA